MAIGDILTWSGGGLLLLMTVIQISPIKLNPWSWLFRAIGKALNGEVIERVDKFNGDIIKRVDKIDETVQQQLAAAEEQKALECRYRILRFGDECRQGINHSREFFDQALEDVSFYKIYCGNHKNFVNNKTTLTIELIEEIYLRCMKENSFL